MEADGLPRQGTQAAGGVLTHPHRHPPAAAEARDPPQAPPLLREEAGAKSNRPRAVGGCLRVLDNKCIASPPPAP